MAPSARCPAPGSTKAQTAVAEAGHRALGTGCLTATQRLVSGFESVLGRAVNAHGPRVERMTVCVSRETKARITAMGARWRMPASAVAGEVLEVAVPEAWEAFERERADE